jgi:hypothetical protein
MTSPQQQPETTFESAMTALHRAVDPKLIKQREGWRDRNGNVTMVDYIEWHTAADMLDDADPTWQHTVKDIREIGDLCVVTVAITIGGVSREGIGTGNVHNEMGIKKAEHDALKRAAVKFGVGRELYKKETEEIELGGDAALATDNGFPAEPCARNLGELITQKQLGMVRALARELRIDADEECHSVMSCRTDELSKTAASSLIKHLQEMQRPADIEKLPLRQVASVDEKDAERAEEMRTHIDVSLKKVGIAPEEWLARFDTNCNTMIEKEKAYAAVNVKVREKQQQQIEKCFDFQGWNPNERLDEFKKFGISGNLNNATPQQIDAMWQNYVDARMIVIK